MSDQDLSAVRARIDEIDRQIQALISERAGCAQEVARIKQAAGDSDFYRPEREAQVLRKVMERNEGPLPAEEMARLIREIMSSCLALEQPLRVAYFGPAGSYTHAAALKHFGGSVNGVALAAIDEVFREVEAKAAQYGVVPVENSTEGIITHTLDMFARSPLKICGEVDLRIHHNLLSRAPQAAAIRRVYGHPQALAQCREWLTANLAHAEPVAVSNNAEGARLAAEEEDAGAIAGAQAADLYGLPVLVKNIEDEPDNTTRFLVVGHQSVAPSGRDKTSLLVSAPNRPGALFSLLEPFARYGLSMSRIESRPSRRAMWDYVFFVDIEGHVKDEKVNMALKDLAEEATFFRVLGSYPRAVL